VKSGSVDPNLADSSASSRVRLIAAYLSVFLIWGSTYLVIRIGVRDIAPALFAGLRFLAAGTSLLLYAFVTKRPLRRSLADLKTLAVVGILLLVGGNGLVVWSEQWVPSGLAAVIIASVPLFMTSIDSMIPGGYRLSVLGWSGIFIGFGGVIILVYPTFSHGGSIDPLGTAGLILASFFWSAGSVYSKRRTVKGDILVNSAIQMLAGGIALLLLAAGSGEIEATRFTLDGLLSLLYLIVFGSIIGYTAYVYLLHHVAPAKASMYAYINPVVAILLGWAVLAEPLELRTIFATAIILGGVAIVQSAKTQSA
jgi:drug/metabolite transporter (DMT)-like permease